MHSYFFDVKNGVTVRDRVGIPFKLDSEAIQHSISLAKKMQRTEIVTEVDLRISVINESGREIHVELVAPNAAGVPSV